MKLALCIVLTIGIVVPAGSLQPRQLVATASPIHPLPESSELSDSKNQTLEARIVDLEKRGWEAVKNKDYAALGGLMTEDYQEIDMDGRRSKAVAVNNARSITLT